MTHCEFRYWLKGFYELADDLKLDLRQLKIIRNHANLAETTERKLDADIPLFLDQIERHKDKPEEIKRLLEQICCLKDLSNSKEA